MTIQPQLLGIYVFANDLDATIEFYETLGLEIERVGIMLARATMKSGATVELGSTELTQSYDVAFTPHRGPSSNTINFELESRSAVDETYARLVDAGYVGHLAPCDPPWGARFALVDDPNGNVVGLHSTRDRTAEQLLEREHQSG